MVLVMNARKPSNSDHVSIQVGMSSWSADFSSIILFSDYFYRLVSSVKIGKSNNCFSKGPRRQGQTVTRLNGERLHFNLNLPTVSKGNLAVIQWPWMATVRPIDYGPLRVLEALFLKGHQVSKCLVNNDFLQELLRVRGHQGPPLWVRKKWLCVLAKRKHPVFVTVLSFHSKVLSVSYPMASR